MGKILFILFIIFTFIDAKPHAYVTISPQKFFIEKIAKDKINIRTMIEITNEIDDFQPSTKQLNTLEYIDAYFTLGLQIEQSFIDDLRSRNSKLLFFDLGKNITKKDPKYHNWLDPLVVKQIAYNIYEAMVILDPKNKDFYEKNHHDFLDELDRLYFDILYTLRQSDQNNFFVFDDSLTPFFDRFNLQQIKIDFDRSFMTTPEKRQWQKIVQENKIKFILIVNSKNISKANIISKAVNIPIININTYSYNWLANIYNIANQLSK